ncbi:ComEC/Rec2 family competence protein [Defluviimonas sp. SAOS-178_SWC]|uniref:ComEC/Rec2 family competence protein n=1 Tax=Defluviimonas sp. SAOS-178_SWC TaxID=3121287 RepID=UPI0032219753
MRVLTGPLEALGAARGRLLPWAPVFLSVGIGVYFALRVEPGAAGLATAGLVAAVAALAGLRGPDLARIPATALALVVGGLLLASARTHLVSAPVLTFRYYGPVEGRVVGIDRSFSDQLRLTLDHVVLEDVPPDRTPLRVRVALHGEQGFTDPQPGLTVILSAHLSPPDGPVEPGGFDFQRLAWFSRLGAVGYTRSPVLAIAPPEGGLPLLAFRMRRAISTAMQERMEGQPGAFAAALMTGDRSGVAHLTNDALRGANLSHLIAISGLHMGLLTGFVFAACRYGLALVAPLALRLDTRKLAAFLALLAAIFYLVLAGPSVATRRAFIMAAVMLVAVIADRRAISLRSVAIAALIVLVLEPESLVEPGFQMSFGATVALIVTFKPWVAVQWRIPAPLRPMAMLVLSSLAASLATGPIAAAHFNRIAEYGLLANFLAVPLMGLVVMPSGVVAAILSPLGLAAPALWVMEKGTWAILLIASWVSGLDGAVVVVPAPPPLTLPLLALGALAVLIARPLPLRAAGGVAVIAAMAFWAMVERPALLVAGDGSIIGVMGEKGRALSKPKGAGFIAQSWLEDDGDLALQEDAFARPGLTGAPGAFQTVVAGRKVWHFAGKGAAAKAANACTGDGLVILSTDWEGTVPAGCRIYDAAKLRDTGALGVYADGATLRIVSAKDMAGQRLWNIRPGRRSDRRRAALQ